MGYVDEYDLHNLVKDEEDVSNRKKFNWIRSVITTGLILFLLISIIYALTIANSQGNFDKNDADYKYCLDKIGLSDATWETYTVFVSKEVEYPRDQLWKKFIDIGQWKNTLKPLVQDAEWTKGSSFAIDNKFKQTLSLGFPIGDTDSTETIKDFKDHELVSWWKEENGLKSCHVWSFKKIDENKTLVTDVEIFHGFNIALIKPFISESWQKKFSDSVDTFSNN